MSRYPGPPPQDPYYGGYPPQQPSDPYLGGPPPDPYAPPPPPDPYAYGPPPGDSYGQPWPYYPPPPPPPPMRPRRRRGGAGAAVFGLLLVGVGIWILFGDRLAVDLDLGQVWPYAAVVIGAFMVLASVLPGRSDEA